MLLLIETIEIFWDIMEGEKVSYSNNNVGKDDLVITTLLLHVIQQLFQRSLKLEKVAL